MSAHETPAGGLTTEHERLLGQWQRGEVPVDAVLTHFAAAVVQARAEDRARIEAALALADKWETAHGDPPVDPSHISVRHAKTLRAALTTTEDGDHP